MLDVSLKARLWGAILTPVDVLLSRRLELLLGEAIALKGCIDALI